MSKSREVIRKVHQQLDADLAAGDPKAKAFAGMLRGELNAARKSLDMPPLPSADNIWIGSEFRAPSNGVLILGESTYGDDPPLSEYIPSWCRGDQPDATFSRIFNACSGANTTSATHAEREAFWASIAFGNFVQQPVGPTREHRPSPEHYQNAASALPNILQRIDPRGVLILGIGQAEFSESVVRQHQIPCVVTPHPTSRGLKTTTLKAAWDELQSKIRNG